MPRRGGDKHCLGSSLARVECSVLFELIRESLLIPVQFFCLQDLLGTEPKPEWLPDIARPRVQAHARALPALRVQARHVKPNSVMYNEPDLVYYGCSMLFLSLLLPCLFLPSKLNWWAACPKLLAISWVVRKARWNDAKLSASGSGCGFSRVLTRGTDEHSLLHVVLRCLKMFAATPRFARGQSRISFDMFKSLRRVQVHER